MQADCIVFQSIEFKGENDSACIQIRMNQYTENQHDGNGNEKDVCGTMNVGRRPEWNSMEDGEKYDCK